MRSVRPKSVQIPSLPRGDLCLRAVLPAGSVAKTEPCRLAGSAHLFFWPSCRPTRVEKLNLSNHFRTQKPPVGGNIVRSFSSGK